MLMGNVGIMETGCFRTRLILYAKVILCTITVKSTKTLKCDTSVPVSSAGVLLILFTLLTVILDAIVNEQ